jgi:hypothetical protein
MNVNEMIMKGFSFNVSSVKRRGKKMIEITILYYGLEIFYKVIHERIDCNILFYTICKEFLRDSKRDI